MDISWWEYLLQCGATCGALKMTAVEYPNMLLKYQYMTWLST